MDDKRLGRPAIGRGRLNHLDRTRVSTRKKVHDAEALLEQMMTEWMDDSDFGRTVGDELSVVTVT